jgi:BolA-like protein 3
MQVQDISGGCGSMYGIEIVSEKFRGLSMLKQQRLVNGVLGEEIKGWHGVQLKTKVP